MRIVFSLASICRLLLSMPGNSIIARRSPPCWKTLIGGKGPWLVVWSCSQSLAKTRLERPLQIEQCLKWINESRDHVRTPLVASRRVHRTVLDALARLRGNGFGFGLGTVKRGLPKIFITDYPL